MDVTPPDNMFRAMQKFTDAMCGEAPLAVEQSHAANERRALRQGTMDFLHRLIHLAMREGAARAMDPRRSEFGRIEVPRHG